MDNTQASDNPVHEGEVKLTNSPEQPVMETKNQNHTEKDPETPPPEYDLWKINYKKLVKLLIKAGPQAMRQVFNSVHTPINLTSNLSKPTVMATLRRLRAHGLITEQQWASIFSPDRTQISSDYFDANLLFLLLKNISPMTPPYPEGWHRLPQQDDLSLSADLVRIQSYRRMLVQMMTENGGRVEEKEFRAYWEQIKQVLIRVGGSKTKALIEQMERQKTTNYGQDELDYVKELLEWDRRATDISAKEATLERNENRDGNDVSEAIQDSYLQLGRSSSSRNTDSQQQTDVTKPQKDREHHKRYHRTRSSVHSHETTTLSREEIHAHEQSIMTRFQKQLTETIQSDDVIPKLLQYGLLSHEEKNRIMLASRNADRMRLISELIIKKRGNAFDKFCDAIKYKYKKLSDQLIKAKQSPFKVEKPDEVSQCASILKAVYKTTLRSITPIPWYPDAHVSLSDFIQPYYIVDYYGKLFNTQDIVQPKKGSEQTSRVLIEGFEGVGKSTLLSYLAYLWELSDKHHFMSRFKLVFLVDLTTASSDLAVTLLKQCLEAGGYSNSESDIYKLIEDNQESTLFLLDGYEDNNNSQSNIWDLVQNTLYPRSTVIVTVNSRFVTPQLRKMFNTKLVLLGVQPDRQEDLIETYAKLTSTDIEAYTGLLAKVTSDTSTTIQNCALNPLYSLCVCLISQTGGWLDIQTAACLMNSLVSALTKLYTQRYNANSKDENPPDWWTKVTDALEKAAFESLRIGSVLFQGVEISDPDLMESILKLGLVKEVDYVNHNQENKTYSFVSKVFQQYFAAIYLSKLDAEEFHGYLDDLINEQSLHRVAVYLCGIRRDDPELSQKIQDLLAVLANNNMRLCRSSQLGMRGAGSVTTNGTATAMTNSCRMSGLALSLECLAEDDTPTESLALFKNSFPSVIYMKRKVHHSPLSCLGLGKIIAANVLNLSELELQLDHIAVYYEGYMLKFAEAIGKNTTLVTLRLHWTSDALLAAFLANAVQPNQPLHNLYMIDDSHIKKDEASAMICANISRASKNMRNLQTMSFLHCKNPALVTSIVHNIPQQLQTLHLNGCKLNLNCAQELMMKIEKSRSLQELDLGSVKLQCSDFLYISYGIKRNKSLTKLILSDVKMEENAVEGLAEAIKFNKSLKQLEIKRIKLDAEACRAIGNALRINSSLREVNLVDAEVPNDGVRILYRLKTENTTLKGLDSRNIEHSASS